MAFPVNRYVIPAPGYRVIIRTYQGGFEEGTYLNDHRVHRIVLDVPPHVWMRLWELNGGDTWTWKDRIWFAWRCLFPERMNREC